MRYYFTCICLVALSLPGMAQDQDGPIRMNIYPAPAPVDDKPLPDGAIARMGSTLLRHGDAVSFAAYTPDGKALVTAGRDKMVRLWDLATEREIRSFPWDEMDSANRRHPWTVRH